MITFKESYLDNAEYYDKVYACWMGKNIGGTLGVPYESQTRLNDLTFYNPVPCEPLANDDLDLQLVWLHALEQYGPGLTSKQLGREWIDHIFYQFDEYGYGLTNLRLGLEPPLSSFGSPFIDCMGSPIRSEIWACVCPGNPEAAAYYAFQDAIVDHAGGEGVYGEMLFAAMQSAAFLESDKMELLRIGLDCIPEQCQTAQAVRDAIAGYEAGLDWVSNREAIINKYAQPNFTYAPPNIAFTIIGFLYGTDFGDAICMAVNCGYDTDCTGATLGALLGIIGGRDCIPQDWLSPIGENIVVSKEVNGFTAPKDLGELTDRVCMMAGQVGLWVEANLHDIDLEELWDRGNNTVEYMLPLSGYADSMLNLKFIYPDGPSVSLNRNFEFFVQVTNLANVIWEGAITLEVPENWKSQALEPLLLAPGESRQIPLQLTVAGEWSSSYRLNLQLERHFQGSPWSTTNTPIVLVNQHRWLIKETGSDQTEESWSSDNRIPWPEKVRESGWLQAESWIEMPSDQHIRLIVASTGRLQVQMDGVELFTSVESDAFMPAAHRPREGNYAEFKLTQGKRHIQIRLYVEEKTAIPETRILIVGLEDSLYAAKTEVRLG